MREILFRGQGIDGNWYYGVPLVFTDDYVCVTAPHTYNKKVESNTLGQFTGLTDKNGKKIFTNDIVTITALGNDHHQKGVKTIAVVEDYMGNTCLCINGKYQTGTTLYGISVAHTVEVVGNIHDNPELLKGGG
jgi:uncharacterized phage protein (TIGR01671 family)